MERYELPDGWEWRKLAQVVEIGSEQINPSRFPNDEFNYLALENIEQGSGKVIDFTPTSGKNIKSNKFKFTNKHVLYGKLRPYLRKTFAPEFEGVSATDLLPLLPDENNLDRKFLVWWLLLRRYLNMLWGNKLVSKCPVCVQMIWRKCPFPSLVFLNNTVLSPKSRVCSSNRVPPAKP
jgi:type I restriction enzyme S subunit